MNIEKVLMQAGQNLEQIRTAKGLSIQTLVLLSHADEEIILANEGGQEDYPVSAILLRAEELNVDFRQILVEPTAYKLK